MRLQRPKYTKLDLVFCKMSMLWWIRGKPFFCGLIFTFLGVRETFFQGCVAFFRICGCNFRICGSCEDREEIVIESLALYIYACTTFFVISEKVVNHLFCNFRKGGSCEDREEIVMESLVFFIYDGTTSFVKLELDSGVGGKKLF